MMILMMTTMMNILSCSFVAQAMASPPNQLEPYPYLLPFFTGRPDLPPCVPVGFRIPPGLSGECFHCHTPCPAPVFVSSRSMLVCWDGVPGRSRVTMLRLWWSFGMCTGFPGSETHHAIDLCIVVLLVFLDFFFV